MKDESPSNERGTANKHDDNESKSSIDNKIGKTRAFTRRVALKTIAASTGILGLTSPVSGATRKTTIDYKILTDGSVVTKKVPKKWWDHTQHAKSVHSEIKNKYLPKEGIEQVNVQAIEETIAGFKKRAVYLQIDPETGTNAQIPEVYDGVEIRTEDYREVEPKNCESTCTVCNFDPVPGGVKLEDEDTAGTSTCRVDKDGAKYLMTVAHLPEICSDSLGEKGYHCGSHHGNVDDWNASRDWATYYNVTGATLSGYNGKVNNPGGTNYDVNGHLTESGVSVLVGDDNAIKKVGQVTCKTTGKVKSMYNCESLSCGVSDCDWIECANLTHESGDSGAPIFFDNGDGTIDIVAILSKGAKTTCPGYSQNPTAYKINFSDGFTFG